MTVHSISSREKREISELQSLVMGVRDDIQGAEVLICCSYFDQ